MAHVLTADIWHAECFTTQNEGTIKFPNFRNFDFLIEFLDFFLNFWIMFQIVFWLFSEQSLAALHIIMKGMKELGWLSTLPHADIINDITRSNPILSLVANVVLETLGVQAAQVQPKTRQATPNPGNFLTEVPVARAKIKNSIACFD